ncbi:phage terminase Nu1 subunit (DNA packaging protein) [Ancylobacter sp. 3268]|uniref:hypothetical protein n=1 Tax=Ancylobacter sp. 3268 TaxID=2817752 RepID=UPI0028611133|nr:hypothetical protein [Ancylobacter sp. 3268]MDR6952656.1 phage terminase Nu1 subunit (DNA packaging protein) [Ancylobacter sp. 3268]
MKKLTLEDLSRDELLTWIRRCLPFVATRQTDLLWIRHESQSAKAAELGERQIEAGKVEDLAMQEWLASLNGPARRKLACEKAHLDAQDAYGRAQRAYERARAAERALWAALEAAWKEERP